MSTICFGDIPGFKPDIVIALTYDNVRSSCCRGLRWIEFSEIATGKSELDGIGEHTHLRYEPYRGVHYHDLLMTLAHRVTTRNGNIYWHTSGRREYKYLSQFLRRHEVREWELCGGRDYARAVIRNSEAFAASCAGAGLQVARGYPAEDLFTSSHQVWLEDLRNPHKLGEALYRSGLTVNPYSPLPSTSEAGLRLGINELTRLGVDLSDLEVLANVIAGVVSGEIAGEDARREVALVRGRPRMSYCLDSDRAEDVWIGSGLSGIK